MGKRLIQQARGKGSQTYRAPSHNYKGRASHKSLITQTTDGVVLGLTTCRGHSAPLAMVVFGQEEACYMIAPEGIRVGDKVTSGADAEIKPGNATELRSLPEGTLIYNIESSPGDGGKFCRSSGTFARVVAHLKGNVEVLLPSKKKKLFKGACRANIGVVAGGGRLEKPLVKAGNKYFKMKAKNKLYPRVSGKAMNSVDHPFGGSDSASLGRSTSVPRNAPPGRKVGSLRARRSGKKK